MPVMSTVWKLYQYRYIYIYIHSHICEWKDSDLISYVSFINNVVFVVFVVLYLQNAMMFSTAIKF